MGRELERKFAAAPETLDAIQNAYGGFTSITMHTRYFDTPRGDFRTRKWTLRLRTENGKALCTLKTLLPDGSRGEFETESGEITSAIPALVSAGAPAELEALAAGGLREVCGARFTRLAKLLPVPGGAVELALDKGEFTGQGRTAPFCEVEAELKAGEDTVLTRFASALAEKFSLAEEPRSKVQRAMALAEEER